MASHCFLRSLPSSSSSSSLSPNFKKIPKPSYLPSISSRIQTPEPDKDDDDKQKTPFNFLNLSVTLTVISASLPQPSSASAAATVKGKKRAPKKPSTKKLEALSPEELKSWTQGLPLVSERLPYSEVLELKKSEKLKHVIKQSSAKLRQRAEAVLVVLDDSRVMRTVLPSIQSDPKFWGCWDELKVDSLCVNTFTPPLKSPELPPPLLSRIWVPPAVNNFLIKLGEEKPKKKESKKLLELRQARMELRRQNEEDLRRAREETEMMERAMKAQKKEEERRRKKQMRKKKQQQSLVEARDNYVRMADLWSDLATNPNVANALGILFFYIFYRTVVLSYRKQKKDYEDRLKIEKADAEERRKMRQLENEMGGIEGEDEDESEQGKGEENPYLKMAKQFMRSGARVRRAQNKRLPQYLERGVDVKFTDVAGLGKIRLELEEIVKFFTHGDMYRRRGVKIPGLIYLDTDRHLTE